MSHSTSVRVRCVSAMRIGDDCDHEQKSWWDNKVCHRRRSCCDDGRHRERSMWLQVCYELVGNTEDLSCPGTELGTTANGAWPLSTSSPVSESKSDVGRGSCGRTCWWMWGKEDKIGGRRVLEDFICRSGSWRNRGEPGRTSQFHPTNLPELTPFLTSPSSFSLPFLSFISHLLCLPTSSLQFSDIPATQSTHLFIVQRRAQPTLSSFFASLLSAIPLAGLCQPIPKLFFGMRSLV